MANQGTRGLSRQILSYLKQYPDQNVDVEDVAAALGVDEKVASSSISTLKQHGYDIRRPHHGVVIFRPSQPLTADGTRVTMQQRVENFFLANPHVDLTIDEVAAKLGITTVQVSASVFQMRKKGYTIKSPLLGVHVYVPPVEPAPAPAPVSKTENPEATRQRAALTDPVKIAEREAEVTAYVEDERHPTQAPPLADFWPPNALPNPVPAATLPLSTVPAGEVVGVMTARKPGSHLYEEIGTTTAGDILVRDDEGVVYRLVRL